MSKPKKIYHLTPVGSLALLGALVCLLVAITFGVQTPHSSRGADVPNIEAAGAACGFGIACGLCVLAAAVAEAGSGRGKPSETPKDEPPAPPTV